MWISANRTGIRGARDVPRLRTQEVKRIMVKKGQEQVSAADSPLQGLPRDPNEPKIKHTGHGSRSQTRAKPPSEGSSSSKGH